MLIALPVFSVLWYHGACAVIVGQFAVIEKPATGRRAGDQRERVLLGGALLGLSICKPQMSFLLIPFVLLWTVSGGCWGVPAAFAAVFLSSIAVSFALVPSWLIDWLRQMYAYPATPPWARPSRYIR